MENIDDLLRVARDTADVFWRAYDASNGNRARLNAHSTPRSNAAARLSDRTHSRPSSGTSSIGAPSAVLDPPAGALPRELKLGR
jgi:hypothetical protein